MSGPFFSRLDLAEFRNYARLSLDVGSGCICLFGENGAGKTNILEAISVLGPGRALRGAELADMGRRDLARGAAPNPKPWQVSGRLHTASGPIQIAAGVEDMQSAWRRFGRIDGAVSTPQKLASILRLVWLTPNMDRLFAGPRSERLKFFDRLTFGLVPDHGAAVAGYERALRERQKLLEEPAPDPAWLDAVEARAAAFAADLVRARVDMLRLLDAQIALAPRAPFPRAEIALAGAMEAEAASGADAPALAARLQAAWRSGRPRDAQAGRCLAGPHRSDLLVRHTLKDQPADASSTGEQKALLIGIILAYAAALAARAPDAAPILLLDEAAAHLDAARREGLAARLESLGCQAWLTGVDASLFDAFSAAAPRIEIRDGAARQL